MAFTTADVEAFLAALREDPALRERAREVILADDFQALPGIVARLAERSERIDEHIQALIESMSGFNERMDAFERRMDAFNERMDAFERRMDAFDKRMDAFERRMDAFDKRMDAFESRLERFEGQLRALTERVEALTAAVEQLARSIEQLATRQDRSEGRLGNVEGRLYEQAFRMNLGAHLGVRFRNIRPVVLANEELFNTAFDKGLYTPDEWRDINRLDAIAFVRDRGGASAGEQLVAIEISRTVDEQDVGRAARRARMLERAGVPALAVVGGETATPEAVVAARALDVVVLVDREAA